MTNDLKQFLVENEVTIEQYFILYMLYTDSDFLCKYMEVNKNRLDKITIFQDLLVKGYISVVNKDEGLHCDNFLLLKEFDDIFQNDLVDEFYKESLTNVVERVDQQWAEFLELYPKKSDGRPLHNMKEKCKEKYIRILRNTKHEDVMKGLQKEIDMREKAKIRKKFFPEWKLLSTYINQKGWEQFLELQDENENFTFGLDGRITRVL